MKAIALVNVMAGSVGPDGPRRLREELARLGIVDAAVHEFDVDNTAHQLSELSRTPRDLMIVWGGDGTHRAALDAIGRDARDLLLLPGGTMNLLSKWVHGARPWTEVLHRVVRAPRTRRLSAGEVNGARFFCAMLAGVPAQFAEAREHLREGDFVRALHDVGAAFDTLGHLHLAARLVSGKAVGTDADTSNVVGAMVGPLSSSGRMEAVTLTLPSALSAIDFAWSSLRSHMHAPPSAAIRQAEEIVISCAEGENVPAIIDGEKVDVGNNFRIKFVERGASCLIG